MATIFRHQPHPHVRARKDAGPVKVADQHDRSSGIARFNAQVAVIVTKAVGSMWCAYAFALFDLISLPDAIRAGTAAIVSWIAQTFLQLVLLSVIMVGQDVQAKASDARSQQTYLDAEAVLHEAQQIQAHLQAQDDVLTRLAGPGAALGALRKLSDDVAGLAEAVHVAVSAMRAPADPPPGSERAASPPAAHPQAGPADKGQPPLTRKLRDPDAPKGM